MELRKWKAHCHRVPLSDCCTHLKPLQLAHLATHSYHRCPRTHVCWLENAESLAGFSLLLSAYSSITNDGRFLAVSNMRTGFDVYELRSLSELEPVRSFKQERSEERPLPVVFVQSGRALVGGTSRGRIHVWSLESQHKQGLDFDGALSRPRRFTP